ncbi:gonadotropin-releasing hormone II receptor [Trichonephila clavata]|uniref:Gonadotropin-releasing hormone II receptor n=1 Tax=Trichonephila clavata TaxID=2740835 RepID=A0A8X6KXM2_TRICU|nr:gonadotropin-releasing hormone II receptor [Trichonephila clavata]
MPEYLPHPIPPNGVQNVLLADRLRHPYVHHHILLLSHPLENVQKVKKFGITEILTREKKRRPDIVQQPYYRRRLFLRQPGTEQMERARSRTLRMTILLVLVFFLYWTPYVIVVMWNLFHPVSAKKVDPKLQSYLFILAVSSSCFKPLVYGSYALNFKQTFSKCCVKRANLKDQFDESLSDYNPREEDPFRENQL